MSTASYGTITASNTLGDQITFSNINVTEIDTIVGSAALEPFISSAGSPQAYSSPPGVGFGWPSLIIEAFSSGGGTATETMTFTYGISSDSPGLNITGIEPVYLIDAQTGNASFTAVEDVYNSGGTLVGTNDFNSSISLSPQATTIDGAGIQSGSVTLTITMTATSAAGGTSDIKASIIAQDFTETPVPVVPTVSIDKQISADGGATWLDVGDGVLNGPTVLAGSTVEERVIITNTGSVALSNLAVTDVGAGASALGGTFNLGGVTTLAAGGTLISNVGSFVATGTVEQFDTATVTGVGTGTTISVSATDEANYTPEMPSISIDKQISPNGGTTWLDVGDGNLQDPIVLAGTTMEERVIVTNTGSITLTNLSVSDVGAGPSGFTLTSSTLAAGASETSLVGTYVATGTVHQYDTATVTGTATDTYNNSTTVTANDTADFTPASPAVSLDKQISTDGTNWVDVGVGNLTQDPVVTVGSPVYERVIVTNTGSLALSSLSVSDVGGNGPASFSVGTTLAVGASETSAVATIDAAAGYQLDTATVTGIGSDNYGHSQSVTASDQANYTGASSQLPSTTQLVIIKQPCVTAIAECGCSSGSGGSGCGSGGGSSCGGGTQGGQGGGSSCGGQSGGGSCGSQGGGSYCGSQGPASSCGGQGGGSSCGSQGGGSSCGDQSSGSYCGSQGSSGSSCGSGGGSSGCSSGQGTSGYNGCGSTQGSGSSCGGGGSGSQWGGGFFSGCGQSGGGSSGCGSSGGSSGCGSGGGSNGCGSGSGSSCSNEGVTYTYTVENTGTTTLYNVTVTDVVNGTTTKTFTDSSPLAAGGTWTFTDTTYATTLPPLNSPAGGTAYGSTDTATVTATTTSSKTSTAATPANTEARVQIGNAASGDNVQIGGTAPTGSLISVFGKPAVIEFNYSPGNTVSTGSAGVGSVTGSTPPTPAFIIVDNVASDSTSGATLYFEGTVKSGMNFYADSTVNPLTGVATGTDFPTAAGDLVYAHIFTSEAAWQAGQSAKQEISYAVNGSSSMHIGDTIGSLKVVGYVSTTNQGYAV